MPPMNSLPALDPVLDSLLTALGDDVQAVYLYGSYAQGFYQPGESDINVWVVTTDEADFAPAREALLMVWTEQVAAAFRTPPALVRHAAFSRHLQLNPALAYHLSHEGKLLAGEQILPTAPPPDPTDMLAQDIIQAMLASSAVASHLLDPEIAPERLHQLRHLARRLSRQPQSAELTPVQLLGCVQNQLQARLGALPNPPGPHPPPDELAPPLLPDLQAIYEVAEEVLLVLPDLSSQRLGQTNWSEVGALLAGDYNGLRLTTSTQLNLALSVSNPLSIRLMRYTHVWGHDGLADVPVAVSGICREAARHCSQLLAVTFPQMVLAAADEKSGKVIHDIQNKLLNIQLQHELLHRMLGWERTQPPMPLLDRHAPAWERIMANFAHLEWWTDYYGQKIGS